ncbi:hypothetical protein FNV43_RR00159 [Rhamnella rubrinervis]|uniref:Uncharacterized protein n=1 Tax=Rhamnella rubrinervis TaxID=2594499 RepID=A0A8K0MRR2_9ROSA|nr:hypothetical protein FNV43_RR00159 [Rhamnella rubrinervis]
MAVSYLHSLDSIRVGVPATSRITFMEASSVLKFPLTRYTWSFLFIRNSIIVLVVLILRCVASADTYRITNSLDHFMHLAEIPLIDLQVMPIVFDCNFYGMDRNMSLDDASTVKNTSLCPGASICR